MDKGHKGEITGERDHESTVPAMKDNLTPKVKNDLS